MNCKRSVEQKFTANGEDVKVSYFRFTNDKDQSAELLLALIQDFDNTVPTYDLFNVLNVTRVIDRFRRCLGGTALQDWDLIRQTTPANTQVAFRNCKYELVREITSDNVVRDVKNYLKMTRKPKEWNVKTWLKRMRAINSYIPMLTTTATAMNEDQLINDCIVPNILKVGSLVSKCSRVTC